MKQLFLQRANARNQSIVLAMVCLVLLFTDIRYTYLQPVRAFAGASEKHALRTYECRHLALEADQGWRSHHPQHPPNTGVDE